MTVSQGASVVPGKALLLLHQVGLSRGASGPGCCCTNDL